MRPKVAWKQVQWRPKACLPRSQVAWPQSGWLFAAGSLTRHLIEASGGDFRVQILRQEWAHPCPHEAQILDIKPHQICMLREVLLICRGKPWVYARSLLPESSLRGKLRFLRKLDDRPLGALLFSEPSMRKGVQEFAQLDTQSLPPPGAIPTTAKAWGRRSVYFLHQRPLLVAEVFLPAIAEASPPSG